MEECITPSPAIKYPGACQKLEEQGCGLDSGSYSPALPRTPRGRQGMGMGDVASSHPPGFAGARETRALFTPLGLSEQGGGPAGKPLIRALPFRNADTGWTGTTSQPKRCHPYHPGGKIKSAAILVSAESECGATCGAARQVGRAPPRRCTNGASPCRPPRPGPFPHTEKRNQVSGKPLRRWKTQFHAHSGREGTGLRPTSPTCDDAPHRPEPLEEGVPTPQQHQ